MTSPGERAFLRDMAAGKTVCEIGSWHGGSLQWIATTALEAHSIDWHNGMDDQHPDFDCDSLHRMWEQVRSRPNIVLHVGTVHQVAPCLRDGLFDLVFIDGSHNADAVKRDVRLMQPKVRRGGLFALHDFGIGLGVDEAVHDIWGEPLRVHDSIAVCHG